MIDMRPGQRQPSRSRSGPLRACDWCKGEGYRYVSRDWDECNFCRGYGRLGADIRFDLAGDQWETTQ